MIGIITNNINTNVWFENCLFDEWEKLLKLDVINSLKSANKNFCTDKLPGTRWKLSYPPYQHLHYIKCDIHPEYRSIASKRCVIINHESRNNSVLFRCTKKKVEIQGIPFRIEFDRPAVKRWEAVAERKQQRGEKKGKKRKGKRGKKEKTNWSTCARWIPARVQGSGSSPGTHPFTDPGIIIQIVRIAHERLI